MSKIISVVLSIRKEYVFTVLLLLVMMLSSAGESLKKRSSEDAVKNAEMLKSFRSLGVIKMGQTIGTIETYYSKKQRSRSTLILGDFQITQVFDGQQAWMKDQNDQVMELTGPDKKQLVNTGWLLGKSYLLTR